MIAAKITETAATSKSGQRPMDATTEAMKTARAFKTAPRTVERMKVLICGRRAAPKMANSKGQLLLMISPS